MPVLELTIHRETDSGYSVIVALTRRATSCFSTTKGCLHLTPSRAKLVTYYARLYGLTRDELRYILDPKEVHGEDFPSEMFRVVKEKEVRMYGEYRTSRLVLEAWDA